MRHAAINKSPDRIIKCVKPKGVKRGFDDDVCDSGLSSISIRIDEDVPFG
jgi:hypothetical protein